MLSITRDEGEQLMLTLEDGRTIRIVCYMRRYGRSVRLLFEAPKSVRIDRMEIWERKQEDAETFAPLLAAIQVPALSPGRWAEYGPEAYAAMRVEQASRLLNVVDVEPALV